MYDNIILTLDSVYLDHVVMADKDGVLLQLGDGHNVHQLVARHHGLRPVRLFQLITGGFELRVSMLRVV